MRKAKIICTVGPASSSREIIHKMIMSGMDVCRLNFSHGTYKEHKMVVKHIRDISQKYDVPVAILQDLKGLKIRVGAIKGGSVLIKKNSVMTLTTKAVMGDDRRISISYPHLIKDVRAGEKILMDDGLLQFTVIDKKKDGLVAKVIEGGILKEKKGVNLPGTKISGAVFTEKDKEDLSFGLSLGIDYVAMSFVNSADNILDVKNWLKRHKADIPVIAKIERPQALRNIDEIIEVSDGLMIARGDLGVEVPPEKVPLIQKDLIEKCNTSKKLVITATQMLESMTEHLTPTRAEAADIANAVLDGTDALMLSGETAAGKYPVEALRMMDRIISYTETHRPEALPFAEMGSQSFAGAIAESACISATDIKAKAIVAFSRTGFTALLVSKFRPHVPIIGFTVKKEVRRRMNLYWGITPHIMKFPGSTDEMIHETERALLKKGLVKKGDGLVIIATSPFAPGGKTNIMKLHKVGF
ncbi:MAG: pyruvate kinase [Nitrospirae bacterium]|nr:pyruvate kinase [Nitrospirota bacterium]